MSERDPNYRSIQVYEYGDLREITLKCLFSRDDCILWSASYEKDGRIETIGGCPGPFEALMWVLAKARKEKPVSSLSHIKDDVTREQVKHTLDLLKDYKAVAKWLRESQHDFQQLFWADRLKLLSVYLKEQGIPRASIMKSDIDFYRLWVTTPLERANTYVPYPWIVTFTINGTLPEDSE
jgi:hypothetical protein